MGLLPVKPDLQRIRDARWRAKMFRDHGNWRRFLKNTCFTLIFLLNWCCCSKLRRFSDQTKIVRSTWIENHGLIELNCIILAMLRALPRTVCLVIPPVHVPYMYRTCTVHVPVHVPAWHQRRQAGSSTINTLLPIISHHILPSRSELIFWGPKWGTLSICEINELIIYLITSN